MTATLNQLDFDAAMNDFSSMFPSFDRATIERVLRANNGLVDATIDQLLAMCVAERDSRDAIDGSVQRQSQVLLMLSVHLKFANKRVQSVRKGF